MTSLGIASSAEASRGSEVQVGFRGGWLRAVAVKFGGAGLIGLALAVIALAQKQPAQVFDLLKGWGWVWLITMLGMFILWDLAKLALGYLGSLTQSVKETAVAMNRIADKDDRERDRMVTETQYVSQRLQRMAEAHDEWKEEQRGHNLRVEKLLESLGEKKG